MVVLREIEPDTPLDEIKAIFEDNAKCSVKCLHCEFAGNRSWYLSFKDELEAQIAVQFLKEEVQTFKGQSLFARIKTHPIPRSVNLGSGKLFTSASRPPLPPNAVENHHLNQQHQHHQNDGISGVDSVKSPLLSTKSDATDDDMSTVDLLSPPANTKSSSQMSYGSSKSQPQPVIKQFNNELPVGHQTLPPPPPPQSQFGMQTPQSQNLQYHLPASYPFSQEAAYKYYINSSKRF